MARSSRPFAAWTRYLGAVALLAVGLDHVEQFSIDQYAAIPTIGTLFVLNFVGATLIACGLAAPTERLPGRAGAIALRLLCAGGIGVAAGSLAGLLVSESTGLFSFMENGYRPAIVLSIALDAASIALLGLHLAIARSPRNRRAAGTASVFDAPRVTGNESTSRSRDMTHTRIPLDHDDADAQIDELLDRIRTLVSDHGVLESDGASELELRANRRALERLRTRLEGLVKQTHEVPPAA